MPNERFLAPNERRLSAGVGGLCRLTILEVERAVEVDAVENSDRCGHCFSCAGAGLVRLARAGIVVGEKGKAAQGADVAGGNVPTPSPHTAPVG